jgi:ketosteroid isomerase-like protein
VTRRRAVVLLLALVGAAGCGRSDPERELRATIDSMARAIEQHEPAAFLDALADDFSRESGAFGKQDAKRTLVAAVLRNEKINVSAVATEVRVDGDRAFARVRVVATGGAGLLPERGQAWDFESAWRRERGQWKVFNAEWREGL